MVFIAAGMAAAGLIGADYDYKGVVLIAALYLLRGNRKNQCIFAPLLFLGSFLLDVPLGLRTGASVLASLSIEFFCIFSFFFLYADNGKRYMKKGKYFFWVSAVCLSGCGKDEKADNLRSSDGLYLQKYNPSESFYCFPGNPMLQYPSVTHKCMQWKDNF